MNQENKQYIQQSKTINNSIEDELEKLRNEIPSQFHHLLTEDEDEHILHDSLLSSQINMIAEIQVNKKQRDLIVQDRMFTLTFEFFPFLFIVLFCSMSLVLKQNYVLN